MASRVVDRARFDGFVASVAVALGHADRRWPLEAYLTGLLLPGERKSVEPIAARVDPAHVGRAHQALHHFVAVSPWDEREVLRVAREYALELLERQAPLAGWVIDETSVPKKGRHGRGAAVLQDVGEGGELPGGGEREPREPQRERAGRLALVPAEGVGDGPCAVRSGGGPAGGWVPREVEDRARAKRWTPILGQAR
jgi:hypothetical protein